MGGPGSSTAEAGESNWDQGNEADGSRRFTVRHTAPLDAPPWGRGRLVDGAFAFGFTPPGMLTADDLRACVQAFVNDIATLVRLHALEAAKAALGAASPTLPAPRSAAPRTPTRTSEARRATASTRRTRGARRVASAARPTKRDIESLIHKLAGYVREHPGSAMGTIGAALGVTPTELRYPAKKLMAERKIRAEGSKQNTRYFPVLLA
jgi:hypothetical protein